MGEGDRKGVKAKRVVRASAHFTSLKYHKPGNEIMTTSEKYSIGFVTSKDGTKIGYRQLGQGEGLILVHGAMMYSQNFMTLAGLLADEFTVYIPDRRGRGLSDAHVENYGLSTESEDIQAIINKTKAQNIFGLSAGAIIVLKTAIIESSIKKMALYEPPISVNGTKSLAWIDKCEAALSKQHFGKAFISIVKGTDDPSSLFNMLPGFITAPLMNFAINYEAKKDKTDGEVSLKSLISAMPYDIKVVLDAENIIHECKDLAKDALLLSGQRSQHYLQAAPDALAAVLPRARRVAFRGLGHTAADNGGKPEVIAEELRKFFRITK